MSHIVSIQTEVRDPAAVQAACRRLGLAAPSFGVAKLYSAQETGWVVRLPGWHYPVVCQTETGKLAYDNFNGHWGEQRELDLWLQAYAVEKAKLEARKKGHIASEQTLADGSIKVTIQVGGAA
jgi:hypothetical protein